MDFFPQIQSFFAMAVETVIGNGKNTRFWTDWWLLDQSLEHTLPHLFSSSPMGAAFKCCAATWSGGYTHLEIHNLWYVLHQISLCGLIYWSQYFQFLVANLQELGPKERKCKFFIRTVAHNWCWTADRLARWGLTHPPRCPLCDQVGETIDHLMVSCVFTRQMWYTILQFFRLQLFAPQLGDLISVDWWSAVDSKVAGC